MSTEFKKTLIASRRPNPIPVASPLGRVLLHLKNARVEYRFWEGHEPTGTIELAGSGTFFAEVSERGLSCSVQGDMFKPSTCAFAFHKFWLTRRGLVLAVFQLAEDHPTEKRFSAGAFLEFTNVSNVGLRKEAELYRQRMTLGKNA